MRDKTRIIKVLAYLYEYWSRNPDLRLGQVITNLSHSASPCPGVFYMEDDELLKQLKKELYGEQD